MGQVTYIVAFQCSLSVMITGFQEWVSQKDQAETVLAFVT